METSTVRFSHALGLIRNTVSTTGQAALALTIAAGLTATALASDSAEDRLATAPLGEQLEVAKGHLEAAAGAIRYAATALDHVLDTEPALRPALPTLTAAQYAALDKIAHHDTTLSAFSRGASIYAGTHTIHRKPFQVLETHNLIAISRATSPLGPQRVRVTTAGHLALRVQKPTQPPAAAPAAAKSTAQRRK
ncbi:hypothetical protein ACFY1V_13125 [Streptomyces sp. NPDC001255]|uniref:hypothetical protein n=1 Tax=Streptomyces sp. NPDC001255 TaxID=3364550 RepID=UPI0036D14F2A